MTDVAAGKTSPKLCVAISFVPCRNNYSFHNLGVMSQQLLATFAIQYRNGWGSRSRAIAKVAMQ